MFGIRFATPLIPLCYVREAHAPDSWIGIIGTVQSLTLLVGYYCVAPAGASVTRRGVC